MHKLKSMFKKDKDDHHESTPSSSSSGAHPVSSSSNQQTSSYGGQQASSSSGQQAYGGQQVGGASSSSRQQDPAYGGQQASPVSRQQDPSYGGQQAPPSSRQQDPSYGGQQAAPSSRQQAPTGSAFPPNNAPSTGADKANNAEGVVMHTNVGDIIIALFSQECPRTCKNFATLAATGKYDNVIFHRIIPGFMIQGGDPTGTGRGGSSIYGEKFEDEFVSDLRHTGKGIMSMANSGPNTNGSQFFLCLAATPHLDGKHTVFGQVADGMDVVDRLGAVKTGAQDRPVQEVKIMRCDVF